MKDEQIQHQFEGSGQENDKGPFYAFNFGAPILNLIDHKVGLEKVEPFTLAVVRDSQEFIDPGRAEGKGRVRVSKYQGMVIDKEAVIPILAVHNRNWLNEAYNQNGLHFIKAFDNLDEELVSPQAFLGLICPDRFTIDDVLDEELEEEVRAFGALAVYRDRCRSAHQLLRAAEGGKRYQPAQRKLYLAAVQEIEKAFHTYNRIFTRYLDEQDNKIRLQMNGGQGKAQYDDRDRYYQWLLAREGVDTALTRALAAPKSTGGFSSEDLAAAVSVGVATTIE